MITLDGIIFTSRNAAGGVSVYFRELLREAVLAQEEVQILIHGDQVSAANLCCQPNQLLFRAPRVLERLRSLSGLPDGVLHSSYYRTSSQPEIRNVVTVYDFTYEKFTGGIRSAFHARQKRSAVMRADAVICISENTRQDLHRYFPEYPADRTHVIHLAAGEEFCPLGEARCELTDRPFVLFVGGRSGYKNFAAAAAAVELAGDFDLVGVGGGAFTPEERGRLESRLSGRYFHAGAASSSDLNRLYNTAVCLIYPSLYEGFGIPPLEAMKAGCPFVAVRHSSIPEVAGDAGILLEEPDPRLFAVAIKDCANPVRREALRAAGLEQARRFSWNRTYRETSAVWRQVENLRHPRR